MRRGPRSGGGRGVEGARRWTAKAAFNLAAAASSQLSEGDGVSVWGRYMYIYIYLICLCISATLSLFAFLSVGFSSPPPPQRAAHVEAILLERTRQASQLRVWLLPSEGGGDDGIKTHHNAAVISP